MSFQEIVVLLGAVAFGGFGIALLIAPSKMAAVDLLVQTPNARSEVRAMYGGLEIGIAVALVLSTVRPGMLNPGLWFLTVALSGLAAGRVLGIVLERGRVAGLIYSFAVLEAVAALICWIALKQL